MEIILREYPRIYDESQQTSFLGISPLDPKGWEKSLDLVRRRSFNRVQLSDLLHNYNLSIGNDDTALEKIRELKNDEAFCVFTGQQLGLMGGPSYTVLKAITCLSVAKKHQAIPVFWLATEDHDIDEIDHTFLMDVLGNLKKFHLALPKDGRLVEDLEITPNHLEVFQSFFESLDQRELFAELANETSYAQMMAKLLVKLFRGTGLVFLEPHLLRPYAKEFFKTEISASDRISQILTETTDRYRDAGGKVQLEISGGTNLFVKVKGKFRCKLIKSGEKYRAGKTEYTKAQLLQLVDDSPELFSTNASARPVLQSFLFPAVAYVAGPGELAYYHQLKEYHKFHGTTMPWIIPRIGATFITPEARVMLEKCHLNPWDDIPCHWSDVIPNLDEGIEDIMADWLKSASHYFSQDLSEEALARFVRNSTRQLKRKICMLRLKRRGIPPHSLHYLRNLIHPHEKPQERVMNWWEFQSHSDENLVLELLNKADISNPGHLYCYL